MATVVSGERRVDAEDLRQRIARAASGLADLGIGPGSGVAMCLRNDLEFFEVSAAAGTLGAFAIPINWHLSADEVRYVLEDSGAAVLVIHADLLPRLGPGIPAGVHVFAVTTSEVLRQAFGIDAQAGAVPAGVTDWAAWLEGCPPRLEPAEGMSLAVFYTSGTTGRQKGVRRPAFTGPQQVAFARMLATAYGLSAGEDPRRIVAAVVGPLYHGAPNAQALFWFRAGADLVIRPRFDAEDLLRTIESERITHLNMVPVMFRRLLTLPPSVRDRYDLSSLRFVAHSAAPCPPDVKQAMIDWWGPIVCEYYGATELGNAAFCTTEEWLAHPGTVGRAIDGTEIRILDDARRVLGPHQIGEIAVRGELGDFTYHNDEANRRSVDRDGFTAPGDVGYLDGDGYLFLCDRKVDMIISGGVNIYPAEIEAALAAMPEVADAAVFGIPDDDFGESVCAVIEPRPGHSPDADQVQAFLRARIAGYKVPRRIEFADALPREDSGKIFKRKLRAPYWEKAGRSI